MLAVLAARSLRVEPAGTALGLTVAALPLLLLSSLAAVLAGLAAIGVGTFLAQAVATELKADKLVFLRDHPED